MTIQMPPVSAAVAAATGYTGQRPMYSRPWLGRPFLLTDTTMGWGRYTVPSNGVPADGLRDVDPDALARILREQMHFHVPDDEPHFEREVQALRSPHDAGAVLAAVFESAKPLHGVEARQFEYIGPHRGSHLAKVFDHAGAEYFVVFDGERVLRSVEEAVVGRRVVWMHD